MWVQVWVQRVWVWVRAWPMSPVWKYRSPSEPVENSVWFFVCTRRRQAAAAMAEIAQRQGRISAGTERMIPAANAGASVGAGVRVRTCRSGSTLSPSTKYPAATTGPPMSTSPRGMRICRRVIKGDEEGKWGQRHWGAPGLGDASCPGVSPFLGEGEIFPGSGVWAGFRALGSLASLRR